MSRDKIIKRIGDFKISLINMLKDVMEKVVSMLEQIGYLGSEMETGNGNARGKMETQEQNCTVRCF